MDPKRQPEKKKAIKIPVGEKSSSWPFFMTLQYVVICALISVLSLQFLMQTKLFFTVSN
jgi:hypothetical protein